MKIGAVNAYGAMSAVSFRPYVYNTNMVSAVSLNKLSRISDDVLDKKIDYSELTDESLNENPLRKGQTLDFQSMLQMQMQRGQNNAARIMKPAQESLKTEEEPSQVSETEQASGAVMVQFSQASDEITEIAADENVSANADNNGGNTNYQMQQAINAYEMFMTA